MYARALVLYSCQRKYNKVTAVRYSSYNISQLRVCQGFIVWRSPTSNTMPANVNCFCAKYSSLITQLHSLCLPVAITEINKSRPRIRAAHDQQPHSSRTEINSSCGYYRVNTIEGISSGDTCTRITASETGALFHQSKSSGDNDNNIMLLFMWHLPIIAYLHIDT